MKRVVLLLVAGILFVAVEAQARKSRDGYPYGTSRGCVKGDCINGYGIYVYPDYDIYDGNWKDGRPHGSGVLYLVDEEPWAHAHRIVGNWIDGKKHGKVTYVFSNGATRRQYWFHGEDVSSRVASCRDAQTLSGAYKGFVAIVNGLVAAANGESVLEGAARGYDAADEQVVPRAIDLSCDRLLEEFN